MVTNKKIILILLMTFSVYGCNNMLATPDKLEKEKKEAPNPSPIFEIWREINGSVEIEGKSLLFRLNDSRSVDFDIEISKEIYAPPDPPYGKSSLQRINYSLSKEDYHRFKLMLKDLADSSNFKKQYILKRGGLDILVNFTILYKENNIIKKKIFIQDADTTIIEMRDKDGYPAPLEKLIKEVYSIRKRVSNEYGKEIEY